MRAREPSRRAGSSSPRNLRPGGADPLLALQRLVGNRATANAMQLARQVAPALDPDPLPAPTGENEPVAEALRSTGAQFGESSPKVLRLQVLLNAWLGDRVLNADGVYGPKTEAQVSNFQWSTKRYGPAPPGPNPLPPPKPPPPGPDPLPLPLPELDPTGEADPSTVETLEETIFRAYGLEVGDDDVADEALRLVRDNRKTLRLSLLSAMRNVRRLIALDQMGGDFPRTELDYWEAVAEHASGNFPRAEELYIQVIEAWDENGWEGLSANCQAQLELTGKRQPPVMELHPDPGIAEDEPQ